jgi:hypothetical protein
MLQKLGDIVEMIMLLAVRKEVSMAASQIVMRGMNGHAGLHIKAEQAKLRSAPFRGSKCLTASTPLRPFWQQAGQT